MGQYNLNNLEQKLNQKMPMDDEPKSKFSGKNIAILLLVVTVSVAATLYFTTDIFGNDEAELTPSQECEERGGQWSEARYYGCVEPAPDAGKSCTDNTQCSSEACMYVPTQSERATLSGGQSLTGKKGACYDFEFLTACVFTVRSGTVTAQTKCP